MALTRWKGVAITGLAMAVVAIFMLPPRPFPEPGRYGAIMVFWNIGDYHETARYEWTIRNTASAYTWRRRAVTVGDSLQREAAGPRGLRSADGRLSVVHDASLSADSARAWLAILQRELDVLPGDSMAAVPVVVSLTARPVTPANRDPWFTFPVMRFVSQRADRPGCFVMINLTGRGFTRRTSEAAAPRGEVLDWCAIYARYGEPGEQVGRWAIPFVQDRWRNDPVFADLVEAARVPERRAVETEEYPFTAACIHGGGRPCVATAGFVRVSSRSWWFARDAFVRHSSLVANLMAADPRRFGAFWRSQRDPETALTEAWGRPAADVIGEFARRQYAVRPSGPRVELGALASSVGWIVVFMGCGMLFAGRRQVKAPGRA